MSENNTTPPATDAPDGNNNNNQTTNNNNDRTNTDNNRSGGQNNRNNRNRNRANTYVSNHQKDWKGDSEDIGVVLGIKIEKLSNQTSVDGLVKKLEGYAKQNLEYYKDVLCIVTEGKDPVPKLEAEKANLVAEDQKKKYKMEMYLN